MNVKITKLTSVYGAAATPTHQSLMVMVEVESLQQLRCQHFECTIIAEFNPNREKNQTVRKFGGEIFSL
jgi:hypothetical protein